MLNQTEALLVEAIADMLDNDIRLGLGKDDDLKETSPFNYLYHYINDSFAAKVSSSDYADGMCQAFSKVHSYKYIDDESFTTAMTKEMTAQAIPVVEQKKAIAAVKSILNSIAEDKVFAEKDAARNPRMAEIKKASRPEQPLDFEIHHVNLNKQNITSTKGDASPGRAP